MNHFSFLACRSLQQGVFPAEEVGHGLGHQTDRRTVGRIGPFALFDLFGCRISELFVHPDVRLLRHDRIHRRAAWVRHGYGRARPASVPQGRCASVASFQTERPNLARHSGIYPRHAPSRPYCSDGSGLRLFDIVCRPLGQGDAYSLQRRPTAALAASAWFFRSTSQTYAQGQTQRSRLSQGTQGTRGAKKKYVRKNAAESLVFQDEVEIHLHPTLTRMWAPVGHQPEIPAPGQNQKQVVYGGIDYATGKITHTLADTKSGTHFLAFLIALATSYAGSLRKNQVGDTFAFGLMLLFSIFVIVQSPTPQAKPELGRRRGERPGRDEDNRGRDAFANAGFEPWSGCAR